MKRGQAALEFIMTYGWAILAVIVMIGALAYFGVVSPSTFIPERCTSTGVACIDFRLTGGTDLAVEAVFENSFGEAITIQEISARSTRGTADTDCYSGTGAIGAGSRFNLTSCTIVGGSPGLGQKTKVDLEITYLKTQGGVYSHNISAQIQAKVQ